MEQYLLTVDKDVEEMLKELLELAYDTSYAQESEQTGDWTPEQFKTYNDLRTTFKMEKIKPYEKW